MSWEVVGTSPDINQPGSMDGGWATAGEGPDVDDFKYGTNTDKDEVGLADVLMDTFHIAGSDNKDGTRDFLGGSDANERLGLGVKDALNIRNIEGTPDDEFIRMDGNTPVMGGGSEPVSNYNVGDQLTVNQGIQQVKQAGVEVAKGASDFMSGGIAGMDVGFANLINFFDSENEVADEYRKLGEDRFDNLYYPEGAAGAVGDSAREQLMFGAIGGKVADLAVGGSKIIGQTIKKGLNNKGAAASNSEYVANVIRTQKAAERVVESRGIQRGTQEFFDETQRLIRTMPNRGQQHASGAMMPPAVAAAAESLPSKLGNILKKSYNTIIQVLPNGLGGGAASSKLYSELVENISKKYGITTQEAQMIVQHAANNTTRGKTAVDALFKAPSKSGTAAGILFGADRASTSQEERTKRRSNANKLLNIK